MHAPPPSFRRVRAIAIGLVVVLAVAGCGDATEDEEGKSKPGRTIEHRFGETVVPAEPKRIVAVGATDADSLVALGVPPVAAYPNTGFGDGAFFPWLEEQEGMGEVEPLALDASYKVNPEEIAALEPDLILAVNLYEDAEAQYELLSKIAPTVAASADPVDLSWAEQTTEIGRAIGREDDARTLVDDVEAEIAAVAEEHPEFAGKSLAFGGVFDPAAATMVFGEQDYSRVFLAELGFTVPAQQLAELPAIAGPGETQAEVGLERLDLLDADALVLAYLDPAIETDFTGRDVFKAIPAVSDGRYIAADAGTIAGLRLPSVLAVPHVMDSLVPELQKVLAR